MCPYAPPLQDAIGLFKYHRKVSLAAALGDLLCEGLAELASPDAIIPVPLHERRLREREYNQALLLADYIARRLRVPVSYDNLIRTRETAAQTELSRAERLKNLRRAFTVERPDEVAGKRLLVVDDVFTTGTTANECAKALRKAGSAEVEVVTLARTV